MKNKIAIIASGPLKNKEYHKDLLKDFDIYICADGGSNTIKEIGITPDYIVGDLDSIKDSVYQFFKKNDKTKIIKDTDQDKTDLELAIDLAKKLDPKEIIIFCAIGNRIDHTLANIYCLDKIDTKIKSKIVDGKTTIKLLKKDYGFSCNKEDIISVIPISDVSNLNYSGFKWNVKNLETESGWFGLSNKLVEDKGSISFDSGKILVIKVRNNDD